MKRQRLMIGGALAAVLLLFSPAQAQLLGQVGETVGGLTGAVRETLSQGLDRTGLAEPVRAITRLRLRDLLRSNPRTLEADDQGFPVVRGEVVAISPGAAVLSRAQSAGFAIIRTGELDDLGVAIVMLQTPKGMTARRALKQLRSLDPQGQYDLNHIYTSAGTASGPAAGTAARAAGGAARIGLVDSGVAEHPAIAGLVVEQRGFAPGGVTPARHGTAVASLLVGHGNGFQGAAPGMRLLVADVYGNGPTGGSAEALARALAWMAARQVTVVNVSLVGPPNLLVRTAVVALGKRGQLIVAAVGNDGPAAAPLYPASYPGVVAVTGVDAKNKVLIEAGRGTHVDFAAPGSDMVAASANGRYAQVRGTSFAAPLVAGRIAMQNVANPLEALAKEAVDLGKKGPDPVYGRGLVCGKCRNMVN